MATKPYKYEDSTPVDEPTKAVKAKPAAKSKDKPVEYPDATPVDEPTKNYAKGGKTSSFGKGNESKSKSKPKVIQMIAPQMPPPQGAMPPQGARPPMPPQGARPPMPPPAAPAPAMKKGGKVSACKPKKMATGGSVSSRADGIASKGKTKGRVC